MDARTRIMLTAAPLALAACGGQDEAEVPETPMAAEEEAMAEGMPMGSGAETAQAASAEGTVTAVDEEAGKITIDHGPVPQVDWPAMTMAFEADEALRQQVEVGDEVAFDFRTTEGGGQITSIRKK